MSCSEIHTLLSVAILVHSFSEESVVRIGHHQVSIFHLDAERSPQNGWKCKDGLQTLRESLEDQEDSRAARYKGRGEGGREDSA